MLRPEAADLRFLEDVVAAEHLVRAFAGEHDLVAVVAHQLREQIQRRRRRAQERRLGVPDDIGNDAGDVVVRAAQLAVLGAERVDDLALVAALVEFGIVERDRERAQRRVSHSRVASAVISDESRPPLRYAPTGTSARRRSRVALGQQRRSSRSRSCRVGASASDRSARTSAASAVSIDRCRPSRHVSEWPGRQLVDPFEASSAAPASSRT